MNDAPNHGALWRQTFGRWGEDLAARRLQDAGLVLLDRNWHCREGELDLVLSEGARVVFCEVKTRSGTEYGSPAESVTQEKIDRVHRAAMRWLREHHVGWCRVRYDVVTVYAPRGEDPVVQHIRGAF
ncbi:YraN family protein [Amycolatopsis benzoatilytica]|uniref:YraN family protein n=1 Tax=Amycolatopsis benzoatilytica TaxID=346045 RepID=UPI0004840580|nr:YraN family protein [Amycolatopsis benzoatilytica]